MKRWRYGIAAGALSLIWLVSFLKTGLFFDRDLYFIMICFGLLALSLAVTGLSKLLPGILRLSQSRAQLYVLLICPLLMMMIYSYHLAAGSLSVQGTAVQWLTWGFLVTTVTLAGILLMNKEGFIILQAGWHLTGAVLTATALLTVYGVLNIPYIVILFDNTQISATGARLGGMLQYPNTFGALIACFLLERIFAAVSLARLGKLQGRRAAFALLPLLPYTTALLLTESRGSWLAAGAALFAGLLLERQLRVPLLIAAAPFAGAALLYRQLSEVQLAPSPYPGLLLLAGIWAGSLLAGLLLLRLASKEQAAIYRTASVVSGALLATGCALLYTIIAQRLSVGGGTTAARWTIYKDAWQLAKQSFWLGRGGETWRSSYAAIQTQPYVGANVHSGYLDILLNTGAVGLVIILSLLLVIGYQLKQNSPQLLPAYLILVIHSMIDFDWSYVVMWLLLYWLFLMGTVLDLPCSAVQQEQVAGKLGHSFRFWRVRTIAAVWLGVTVSCTVLGFRGEMGERAYEKAMLESSHERSQQLLTKAIEWNPAHSDAVLALAAQLPPDRSVQVLSRGLEYAPQHPKLMWQLADAYARVGASEAYITCLNEALQIDRFNTAKLTKGLEGLLHHADLALQLEREEEALDYIVEGDRLFQQYQDLVQRVENQHSVINDRRFSLTSEAIRSGNTLAALAASLTKNP